MTGPLELIGRASNSGNKSKRIFTMVNKNQDLGSIVSVSEEQAISSNAPSSHRN